MLGFELIFQHSQVLVCMHKILLKKYSSLLARVSFSSSVNYWFNVSIQQYAVEYYR